MQIQNNQPVDVAAVVTRYVVNHQIQNLYVVLISRQDKVDDISFVGVTLR